VKLYLDYNASSRLDTCVLDAVAECLSGMAGNPSSTHQFGRAVRARLDSARTRRSRDCLETGLLRYSEISVFASHAERLANTVQLAIAGIDGEALLMQLDRAGIGVSSGSACSSGKTGPSHVLMAMGVDADLARGAIRISLGKDTRE